MLLSKTHNFIFIKTSKTAGTTVEEALRDVLGAGDVYRQHDGRFNLLPELIQEPPWRSAKALKDWMQRRYLYRHIPAWKIRRRVGTAAWNASFTFCFERNPWDKMVSAYHWDMRHIAEADRPSFERYVRHHRHRDWEKYAVGNRILVDFIGRYECLEADLAAICRHLGVPFDGLERRAKGHARRERKPFQAYYTPASRALVARRFAREIALFGYSFDGGLPTGLPYGRRLSPLAPESEGTEGTEGP